ncbi:cysteine desulfurase family protein [Candidatus Nitrosarchaeum limnium]|uniref:cysteine desulfurase n=1 Tax=Candidatus Nitrosarchaeum limnium BG20 TaxID=859192 RepID=S2EM45_9ARCH|nr:cysteine desulfurase family protein [Candidatus Nitrosarchaeum limnium]EPA05592.1 putative cysteine desulfurase NifS [Candidatus Nitrosarchaeum limnium BG20]
MIYLDNAASTQIHENVLESMLPYLKEQYGNPSSIHRYGRLAHKAIEKARKQIAQLINAESSEILFTSGGTESNNTALYGISEKRPNSQIITSSIEHDAILEPSKRLAKNGYDVVYIPVDDKGTVNLEVLENSLSDNTCLVSIMFANNEVGTIEPISKITKLCNEKNIPFHTDAIQAVGKIPIDVKKLGIDLLSISSHKINGPKGIGALYVRKGIDIDPIILGGGQENGLRSGTENVANIVGFGKACEIANLNLSENIFHMKKLRDILVLKILKEIPGVSLNGHPENRLPNNAHFTFLGVAGEDLIIKLDEYGIAASTGSACSVHTQKASHVLKAMGYSYEQITGSLRLTLGLYNTESQIDETVNILKKVTAELRSVSPFKEKYSF